MTCNHLNKRLKRRFGRKYTSNNCGYEIEARTSYNAQISIYNARLNNMGARDPISVEYTVLAKYVFRISP